MLYSKCTPETDEPFTFNLNVRDGDEERAKVVCFVCEGNTCRSPMAAAVLNHLGKGKYKAFSAGLNAHAGAPIAKNAVKALEKAGIPSSLQNMYKEHFAIQINENIVSGCDLVISVTMLQSIFLLDRFPAYSENILSMPCDIPDPFMQGQDAYDRCLEKIIDGIKRIFPL